MADERAGTVRLPDGRRLGYAEYGDPNGRPLFYFHGFPGSRLQARIAHEHAARNGVRIIALDRPGFGLSDFKPGRTIADWADDVSAAAEALGIERFAVLGISGGGPYAAACARRIPQRLIGAAIVSGLGPLDAPEAKRGMRPLYRFAFFLFRYLPWLARVAMWGLGRAVRRNPERVFDRMSAGAPAADRELLARTEMREMFIADLAEAFRQGGRGPAWDLRLYSRPWGFRLQEITMEVHLWHGEADSDVPPSMGRYQAQAIPNCRAHFYPGEGHLLIAQRMDEVQSTVLPAASRRP